MAKSSSGEPGDVPWSDTVHFIKQLSHDLRNHLNAAELQSAYIGELTTDAELKEEIARLREIISAPAAVLHNLTAAIGPLRPEFMPYRASDFMEDLRQRIAKEFQKENAIKWDVDVNNSTLNIDPQLLFQAMVEIFRNAFAQDAGTGAITAMARIDNGQFIFMLSEAKQNFGLATENWGREPLRHIRRGHYGLGLSRVRGIVEIHDGQFGTHYDSATSTLVTTITLPVAKK